MAWPRIDGVALRAVWTRLRRRVTPVSTREADLTKGIVGARALDLTLLALTLALIVGGLLGARAYEGGLRAGRGTIDLVGRIPTSTEGGWSAREIRIRAGEEVTIRLTSEDVTHGFLVPDLEIRSEPILAGEYQVLRLRADTPGIYTYYCYVLCSHRHGAMIGKLVVEPAG